MFPPFISANRCSTSQQLAEMPGNSFLGRFPLPTNSYLQGAKQHLLSHIWGCLEVLSEARNHQITSGFLGFGHYSPWLYLSFPTIKCLLAVVSTHTLMEGKLILHEQGVFPHFIPLYELLSLIHFPYVSPRRHTKTNIHCNIYETRPDSYYGFKENRKNGHKTGCSTRQAALVVNSAQTDSLLWMR